MNTKNRNKLIDTENTVTVARWDGGCGGWKKKGKGLESTD